MEIIGHRGCADQYPENTVHAVQRSSRYLDTIEVDVRRCGSGELVVFHDETVDRLTAAAGRVADLDWRELRELEVMDSGETIPLLSTVLEAFPRGVRAQVELKQRGLARDVRDVVAEYDVDVTVSSFDTVTLAEVHDLDWEVGTGYLFDSNPVGNLATAIDLGCAVVHPHYDLCLKTDVVDDAHDAGLEVVAWKAARTSEEISAVRNVGVDGITADRWDIG